MTLKVCNQALKGPSVDSTALDRGLFLLVTINRRGAKLCGDMCGSQCVKIISI